MVAQEIRPLVSVAFRSAVTEPLFRFVGNRSGKAQKSSVVP